MTKTKLLIPLVLLSLLALLSACTPPLTKGYVYDKQYQAAYTQYLPGYTSESCVSEGKYGEECTPVYHPAILIYHPAYYYLELTTCSSLQTDGNCQTGEISVDESTYDRTRVGSYYQG